MPSSVTKFSTDEECIAALDALEAEEKKSIAAFDRELSAIEKSINEVAGKNKALRDGMQKTDSSLFVGDESNPLIQLAVAKWALDNDRYTVEHVDDQIALVRALLLRLEKNRHLVLLSKDDKKHTAALIGQAEQDDNLDTRMLSADEVHALKVDDGNLAAALDARGYTPIGKAFRIISGLIEGVDPVNVPQHIECIINMPEDAVNEEANKIGNKGRDEEGDAEGEVEGGEEDDEREMRKLVRKLMRKAMRKTSRNEFYYGCKSPLGYPGLNV